MKIPETVIVSEVQHLVTKIGQHEREDGILHEVIEWAARHLVQFGKVLKVGHLAGTPPGDNKQTQLNWLHYDDGICYM